MDYHLSIDAARDNLTAFGGEQEGAAAGLCLEAELQVLDIDLELDAQHAAQKSLRCPISSVANQNSQGNLS